MAEGESPTSKAAQVERALLEFITVLSPDGVVVIDEDGQIVFVNPRMVEIFGHTIDELVGQSITRLMPQEMRHRHDEAFERYLETNHRNFDWSQVELPGIHKSGAALNLQVTFQSLTKANGERQFVGVIRDNTAAKAKEARHRDEQDQFTAFFERSHEALFVHDPKGQILNANANAVALTQIPLDTLKTMKVKELHDDAAEAQPPKVDLSFAQSFEFKTRWRRGATETFPVAIRVRKIAVGEEPVLVAAVRDLSEEERLHAELQRAQQLELMGRVAGSLSHELNNLLMVILNGAEEVSEFFPRGHGIGDTVDDMKQAASQASVLTARLLGLGRKPGSMPGTTDLNELLRTSRDSFKSLLRDSITLDYGLADEPMVVPIHSSELLQIVANLICNARDAIADEGRITISTKSDQAEDLDLVELDVEDTGAGMHPKTLEKIFEPLFTTKSQGIGVGLGLTNVQAIAEVHGGRVTAESKPGKGSRFRVQLPRKGARPRRSPADNDANSSQRILVVEDMAPVRAMLVRMLRRWGFVVDSVSDGAQAVDSVNEHAPDFYQLVLTDMLMPKMDGGQLATYLDENLPHLPVIILTAYSADMIPSALPSRIKVLTKPVAPKKLQKEVQSVLMRASA